MFRDNKNAYQRLAEIFGINSNARQDNGGNARPKLWDENTDYEGSDPEVKHILSQILNTDYDPDVAMNVAPAWLTKIVENAQTPGIANPDSLSTPKLSPSPSPALETLLRPAGWRAPNFRELGKALMEGWKSPEMIAHEKLQSESPESSPVQPEAAPQNQVPLSLPDTSDWKFGDVSPFRRLVQRLAKELNDSEGQINGNLGNKNSQFEIQTPSDANLPLLASDISTRTDFGDTFSPVYSGQANNTDPLTAGIPGYNGQPVEFPAQPPKVKENDTGTKGGKGKQQQQGHATSKPVNQEPGIHGSNTKTKSQETPPQQQVGGKAADAGNTVSAKDCKSSVCAIVFAGNSYDKVKSEVKDRIKGMEDELFKRSNGKPGNAAPAFSNEEYDKMTMSLLNNMSISNGLKFKSLNEEATELINKGNNVTDSEKKRLSEIYSEMDRIVISTYRAARTKTCAKGQGETDNDLLKRVDRIITHDNTPSDPCDN